MEKHIINPWHWQASQGWSWGIDTRGSERVLYCAGQVATDANGRVLHPGDMAAQLRGALDNLERVLDSAGYSLGDVVRIDYYATDVDAVMQNWSIVADRLLATGCRAGGVLLGITRLAHPDLMIEIQAIAAR
jgi:enamine deaminase RidA (YjgF/YER057c/UK114 family)